MRFLISNKLEELEFNMDFLGGFRNMQEKIENNFFFKNIIVKFFQDQNSFDENRENAVGAHPSNHHVIPQVESR